MSSLPVPLLWLLVHTIIISGGDGQLVKNEILPQTGDLCSVLNHRSAIVGSRLYFMGGKYTFQGGDTASNKQNIYWLDLNKSFPIDGVLSSNSFELTQASTESGWQVTGTFFKSHSTLYSFGRSNDDAALGSLAAFDTATSQWSTAHVAGGDFNHGARHMNMHATGGPGLGFIAGGSDTDLRGMIQFNASNPSKLSWANQTGESVPNTMGATMQYVRMGRAGVLVAIGGYDTTGSLADLGGRFWPTRSMEKIRVYDIDTSTWYNETGTGDIPESRTEFCSAVSASPDDSSFQITIYGGWSLESGTAFKNVYVLTIPSFNWIRIDTKSDAEANLPGITGRKSMTCEMNNERQMVVVGGDVRMGDTQANTKSCNNSYPPIRVLDTTTFTWLDHFSPSLANYTVPEPVYKVIGGGPSGGATAKSPRNGFDSTSLQAIFSQTLARSSALEDTPPPSLSPPPSSKHESMPKATIVGAGIGGIVALSLLGAAVFFWTRNRRRRRRPEVPVKDVKYSDGGEWQKSELPGTEVHEYNVSGGDGEEWQKSELPGAERQKSELPGAENEVKGYMQAHELDAIERS